MYTTVGAFFGNYYWNFVNVFSSSSSSSRSSSWKTTTTTIIIRNFQKINKQMSNDRCVWSAVERTDIRAIIVYVYSADTFQQRPQNTLKFAGFQGGTQFHLSLKVSWTLVLSVIPLINFIYVWICVEKILILYKNCNFYILIVAEVFVVIYPPPLSVSKFQLFVVMSLVIIKKNKQIFYIFFFLNDHYFPSSWNLSFISFFNIFFLLWRNINWHHFSKWYVENILQ